jgi:FkbM family methyltransferase
MLIPLNHLAIKYNLKIKGVLHIGAHLCEEKDDYLKYTNNIIWIEGNPDIANKFNDVYNYLISDKDDETVNFNISNNGQSSSILEFGLHKTLHPHIWYVDKKELKTTRLDTFYKKENIKEDYANFINLDIQGIELQALKSLDNILKNFDYIYTEVNRDYTYKNNSLINEIDEYVKKFGFERVETKWYENKCSWGDAFYVKNNKCF